MFAKMLQKVVCTGMDWLISGSSDDKKVDVLLNPVPSTWLMIKRFFATYKQQFLFSNQVLPL